MYEHLYKTFKDDPFTFAKEDPEGLQAFRGLARRKQDQEVLEKLKLWFDVRTMRKETNEGTYTSSFDPKTGTLVSAVDTKRSHDIVRSPVPETIDISITDWCPVGCNYCYQDSRTDREHGATNLVEKVITGLDQPPYQIAIGGGEPVFHPEFATILRTARELGTVPNYTTSGIGMKPEVIKATNTYCGGVAMTYHAFKGIEWFTKHYTRLREALTCQVNVHLIADKDVALNLDALVQKSNLFGPLNMVLLAYYPDVGRANYDGLMPKQVYQDLLPKAIQNAMHKGFRIAFSEGLLPYFLSRPEIGVDTSFAARSEGAYTCYIDPQGRMSTSSFSPHWVDVEDGMEVLDGKESKKYVEGNVFRMRTQRIWDSIRKWDIIGNNPSGSACYDCKRFSDCSTPHFTHLHNCAYQPHNQKQ